MSVLHRNWRRCLLALLVVSAAGCWPTDLEAAVLTFRNDTDSAILVQGISVVNRIPRRGKLHLLRPGEVSRELVLVPGAKLMLQIVIADFKQPTRPLYQEWIQVAGADLFFVIQAEAPDKSKEGDASPKAKGQGSVAPKVKLVPSKPFPLTPPSAATQRR